MNAISQPLLDHAGAWWTYLVTGLLCWIDGFFPPLPSESIVIGLCTFWKSGQVNLPVLFIFATVGAWLGDNTAYILGRWFQLDRFLKSDKALQKRAWVRDFLFNHGEIAILTVRYIPGVRVVANMVAGTLRYSRRKFMFLTTISALLWAIQAMAIGMFFGHMLGHSPLLAVMAGISVGILVGIFLGRISLYWANRKNRQI